MLHAQNCVLSVQLKIKAVLSGVVLAGKISSTYPDEEQEHEPSAPVCETSEASASASRRLTELEESRMVVEQRAESKSSHSFSRV